MTIRTKIVWGLLGVLVMAGGWWTLVPGITTATEAEVRAHVAPELLQPLPHPQGGSERYAALRRILELLPNQSPVRGKTPEPRDLTNPQVASAFDILRQGALDRTDLTPEQRKQYPYGIASNQQGRFVQLANGLSNGTLQAASRGDWARVTEQMEAACLMLDRLFESDATVLDRRWTLPVEREIYRTTLALAARGDLPAKLAERLSLALVVDRHDSASVQRILRGEMQLVLLGRIGAGPISPYGFNAGTYDPLETAELLSARFVAMAHDAGLPASRRSTDYPRFAPAFAGQFWGRRMSLSSFLDWGWQLQWPVQRIRMNTARNSIGRYEAATYLDGDLMAGMLHARTLQDQVVAALAVVRFRLRAGHDPRDFAELVAAGLLRAVPMDHVLERPLPFDLQALFKWPQSKTGPN